MRLSLTRYLMTFLCMLAAGTWILPVHTLAAPVAVAPTGGEGDDLSTFAEIAEELSDWIGSGELAFGPRFDSSLDLDGDGVHDVICVSSVDLLASGGTIAVLDGATSALRFLMQPPVGERGFGSRVAVVDDLDGDGCRDLVTVSGLMLGGVPEIRHRLVSGLTGKLLAVKGDTILVDSSAETEVDAHLSTAGDANQDREVDSADVALAVSELSAPTVSRAALDLDCDGQVTAVDVVGLLEKAGSGAQISMDADFNLLASTHEFHVVSEDGFLGLSWGCWGRAAGLAVTIALLIGEMSLCAAACTPPTPVCAAALNACYFAIVCTMANAVFKLARLVVECVGDRQLPDGLEGFFELADAVTALCAGGAAVAGFLEVMKRALEILRETLRHL